MSEQQNPTSFNHPEREILNASDIDGLGQAIITLTKEIWVLTDRLHVMESVLAQKGLDISEDIKSFQPDEEMSAKLSAENSALIERVLSALARS